MSKRNPGTLGVWGPNGTRVVASESMWREPSKWNKAAEQAGERRRVFCASLADVFEDWRGQVSHSHGVPMWIMDEAWYRANNSDGAYNNPLFWGAGHVLDDPDSGRPMTLDDVRRRLFALIDSTPWLDWLLLTKRTKNIMPMWPLELIPGTSSMYGFQRRNNVWLGTSIATQEDADHNVPELLKNRDLARVLYLSAEPLLGPVDLSTWLACGDGTGIGNYGFRSEPISWVIVGGESGPGARPMHSDWARSIRDQCTTAGVPFFFKQWGEWTSCPALTSPSVSYQTHEWGKGFKPVRSWKVGKEKAGRTLDGVEWNEFPAVPHKEVARS